MSRHWSSARSLTYAFGPGPPSRIIKALLYANIAAFVLSYFLPILGPLFGLVPRFTFERFWIWQVATYMFLHADVFHILFNMLLLWMFGTEMERVWGPRFFLRYYFLTGIGAGLTTLAVALFHAPTYAALTVGASGAIYGILLAYGLYFPDRPIYMYFFFPIPAKYFVWIMGAIVFFSDQGGAVAHGAHLGGLLFGFAYLKLGRARVAAEIKYRYLKWKMNRLRKKFDVYSGGRQDDWNRRIH